MAVASSLTLFTVATIDSPFKFTFKFLGAAKVPSFLAPTSMALVLASA